MHIYIHKSIYILYNLCNSYYYYWQTIQVHRRAATRRSGGAKGAYIGTLWGEAQGGRAKVYTENREALQISNEKCTYTKKYLFIISWQLLLNHMDL